MTEKKERVVMVLCPKCEGEAYRITIYAEIDELFNRIFDDYTYCDTCNEFFDPERHD